MEHVRCSQELATGQYPEPGESNPPSASSNALNVIGPDIRKDTKSWFYHFLRENQRNKNITELSVFTGKF